MVVLAVTKAVTNLQEAHSKLGISPALDPNFFPEWRDLTDYSITTLEAQTLDRLRQRYLDYADNGSITEGTVNLILVSPLLDLVGLFDAPYQVRGEKYVRFELEDGETRLDGLIDALIVQGNIWLLVVESKRYGFSVRQALAQTLAYLMSSDRSPAFGLITTGEDYLFVKLDLESKQYALSDKFTLSTAQGNDLYTIVQVLRRLVVNNEA